MLHAATAASAIQVSLKASSRDATDLLVPDGSSSSDIAGYITMPCWGDVLAVATGVCSFFICRSLLLPIMLPERASRLATKKALEAPTNEEENELPTDDPAQESKQSGKHAQKVTGREECKRDGGKKEAEMLKGSKQQDTHDKQEETRLKFTDRADAESAAKDADDNQPVERNEQQDCFGCTQLHLAAHLGDATEVAELLDHGFNVHAQDNFGDTPLHLAVRGGCDETVQALLANGAKPHAYNALKTTPWSIAASLKDKTLCRLLAEYA